MNIVKYHNDLNKIILKGYGLKEIDIFYAILFRMKNEKGEATFRIDDIRKLSTSDGGNRSVERFFEQISHVFKTEIHRKVKDGTEIYNLFSMRKINNEKTEVTLKLNYDCLYILNDLVTHYTLFELEEFVQLRGEYSKTLFRLLKQFQSTGELIVMMDDFRLIFEVPENYRQSNINQKILAPAIKELIPTFPNLKYEKLAGKKGVKIEKIVFTWDIEEKTKPEEKLEKKEPTQLKFPFQVEENNQVVVNPIPDEDAEKGLKRVEELQNQFLQKKLIK